MSGPILAARSVSCEYAGRTVVHGVNLDLTGGELVAILGPNGAGKTTLLKVLARLHRPAAGQVLLRGQALHKLSSRTVARTVAFAAQEPGAAWPFTVRESVALGRAPHRGWWRAYSADDRAAVDSAIKRLGLAGLADRRVDTLSGGEAQRVRLARALAQNPSVLLLDEPTAHLDPGFQFELLDGVRTLAADANLAVAVTLHDLNLAGAWADRVLLLAAGQTVALGSPAEVLTEANLQRVYGPQVRVGPHPVTGTPAVMVGPRS